MRPRYVALTALVGALAAGAIVACGGDDDAPIVPVETQTAPVEALSKAEFIDEADAICKEANAALANAAETSAGDPSTLVGEELDVVEGELDQIDTLGAPSQDQSTLNDFIDALEALVKNLDKQQLAVDRDDTTTLAELETDEASIRADLLTAAEDYGFKECGQAAEATTTDTGTGTGAPAPAPVAPAPAPAPAPPSGGTGTGGTGGSGGVSP